MRASKTGREWGDGHGRVSPHVILRVSFGDCSLACECGSVVEPVGTARNNLALERAWDLHRGAANGRTFMLQAVSASDMATDDEVRAFLGRITGERGHNPVSGQLDPSEHVGYDHLDTAFVLLERLLAAREACTCVHAADSATCEEGAR